MPAGSSEQELLKVLLDVVGDAGTRARLCRYFSNRYKTASAVARTVIFLIGLGAAVCAFLFKVQEFTPLGVAAAFTFAISLPIATAAPFFERTLQCLLRYEMRYNSIIAEAEALYPFFEEHGFDAIAERQLYVLLGQLKQLRGNDKFVSKGPLYETTFLSVRSQINFSNGFRPSESLT